MTPTQRVFSFEEANQLLPAVKELLEDIQKKQDRLTKRHDMLFFHELLTQAERQDQNEPQTLVEVEPNTELQQDAQDLEAVAEELETKMSKLRQLGCLVRNIEAGRVEFLGEREGKKIYFSWKQGEATIRYYRLLDGGANDRILID